MKEYLERMPEELQGLLNKLRDIAAREGLKAYLVGGFVRDLILGVKNLDLDIVVEGDGINFACIVANSLGEKITVHRQFGTATVFIKPGLGLDSQFAPAAGSKPAKLAGHIDFSSARKEYYPSPAHLPVVSPGSLRDDLSRRDFTINSLAISLNSSKLVDYFGGQADIKRKVIRVLHPLSFIDDPTRILRAVRFEQRYDFKIEPDTLRLLKEAVKLNYLGKVHPHRIRDELVSVLKESAPAKQIKRLGKLAGFDFIYPGLRFSGNTYLLLRSIRGQVNWFNKENPGRRPLDLWVIYLAGLVDLLDVSRIRRICLKFGLRKGEEKRLLSYKEMRPCDIRYLSSSKIQPSRMFKLLEPLSYETIIALRARHKNKIFRRNTADFLEIYNGMRISVCGQDLRCLGVLPGPRYQKIFERVLSAKLNGRAKTKEEELILIKKLLKKSLP
ncbi:MAG: CCA tRNA nucleotidyltransferase [Candidatus Omnitrophota bacterium]